MENYQEIQERSKRELEELRQQKAVLKSQIESSAKELGLDMEKPLESQIEELKTKLQKDYDVATTELNKLLQQLEEFKAEGDGE